MVDMGNNKSQKSFIIDELEILNTAPEKSFDEITEIAGQLCECPIAIFSLYDNERFWFKSKIGIDFDEISYKQSFCQYALANNDVIVIDDTSKDPRFKQHPLVNNSGYKFFASQIVKDEYGLVIGSLCVIDKKPKSLSNEQRKLLKTLTRQLEIKLQVRRLQRTLLKKEEEKKRFINQVVHDLKNPISIIKMNLEAQKAVDKEFSSTRFYKRINRGVNKLNKLTLTILDYEKLTNPQNINIKENSISYLFNEIKEDIDALKYDHQSFVIENNIFQKLKFDHDVLYRVIENLLSNSIKYAGPNAKIKLSNVLEKNSLKIFIEDNGKGLQTKQIKSSDSQSIFNTSHNIGLKFCRDAIENLGGTLEYEFINNKGSIFTITLKI
tara:strand:+ start:43446 stop:44588 length:1143 start_codon:yes stop_codon:yes gene_type:complete